MIQNVDNFKLHAEGLAREPNCVFSIKLQNGLVISGPSSLLPGLVRDAATGAELERRISEGPIRISIEADHVGFAFKSGPPLEQTN
jgi:hypothetical protein